MRLDMMLLNSAWCRDTSCTSLSAMFLSFILAENQLPQLALDWLKLGGVDERVGADVEE